MLTFPLARRLVRVLAGLALTLAATAAQAAYSFDGSAVSGCSLSGMTYACASLPLTQWNDSMTIASGYTVNVSSSIGIGYNQTLKMSGTARLTTTGNLDIGGVAPSNLQISGGSLAAAGTFTYGNQAQTITADVTAASMTIGGGSNITINGNLSATGTVDLSSHAVVNGNISGTTITTGAQVTLSGDITATNSFTLASGGAVVGNISAPVVTLNPSNATVTGAITAPTSLTLGSGDTVTGTVNTGILTLHSANAIIDGNATVAHATLNHHGRVTGTITCSAGTTAGNCDCVTNNSGYAVNSVNGPKCVGPASTGLHHYLISHPSSGLTCTPATVSVTACANASCDTLYTTANTMVLGPTGQSVAIGTSGINNAVPLAVLTEGVSTLSTATASYACKNSETAATDCKMTFYKSGFVLSASDHFAGAGTTLTVKALKDSPSASDTCAPAFTGDKSVTFSCAYVNPASGTLQASIGGAACGGSVSLHFDNTGTATTAYSYADVGAISVTASQTGPTMTGSKSIITAPSSFKFSNVAYAAPLDPAYPSKNPKSGTSFTTDVAAYNTLGAITPNFGAEMTPATATISHTLCAPAGGATGAISISTAGVKFTSGKAPISLSWDEVGSIDLTATLSTSYLDSGLALASGSSAAAGTCGFGPFVPAYFDVVAQGTARTANYSGEAVKVTVTARNNAAGTTVNYSKNKQAKGVTFAAYDKTSGSVNPGPGSLTANTLAATEFLDGVADSAAPVYTYTTVKTTPVTVLLRATDSDGVSSRNHTEVQRTVRSGRVRIYNRFGSKTSTLELPVTAEYWTGNSWTLNTDDAGQTVIPATAIALSPDSSVALDAPAQVTIDKGVGKLLLVPKTGSGAGSAVIAFNLGSTAADNACLGSHTPSIGAGLAYLRSNNGDCGSTWVNDPSARATFGVFSPETKRIIHVREVYR